MAITAFGIASARRAVSIPVALTFLVLVFSPTPLLKAQSATPSPSSHAQQDQAQIGASVAASTPQITLPPEELGDLHMARRRYQAAIQAYHQVPKMSPAVWNKIGMANQQMFVLDEAKKNYETALKLDPKNADVLNNLGTVHYSLKEYGTAEKLYRKALKINPKSALVYKNLGTALLAQDKFKKGWDCYQTALALDPEIFERSYQYKIGEPTPPQKRGAMNYYLAKSYLRVGMTDRAVDYLRMAIDEGFTDRRKVLADKEFASLHGVSSFEQLISEQRMQ